MEYKRLGRSGLLVSAIGLGTNSFGSRATPEATREVLAAAIDHGVTLIDTANGYSGGRSEALIGELLGDRRHAVLLATKAGMSVGPGPHDRGGSRLHLIHQVDQSLARMKTDYIDLFQLHMFDADTPLEETLRALDDLVTAGKIRYVGASNFRAWQLMKSLGIQEREHYARFISIQPSYSLADRQVEDELVPCLLDQGVGLIAYFPLAGGVLTGKYRAGEAPPPGSRAVTTPRFASRLEDAELMALATGVSELARELNVSPSQLSLAWLLHQPAMASAISGATRPDQVIDNVGATEVPWSEEIASRLDQLSAPFRYRRSRS